MTLLLSSLGERGKNWLCLVHDTYTHHQISRLRPVCALTICVTTSTAVSFVWARPQMILVAETPTELRRMACNQDHPQ
jgi:hypothetical protein